VKPTMRAPSPLEGEGRDGGSPCGARHATIGAWHLPSPGGCARTQPTPRSASGPGCATSNSTATAFADSSQSATSSSISSVPRRNSSWRWTVDSTRKIGGTKSGLDGRKRRATAFLGSGITMYSGTPMASPESSATRYVATPHPGLPPQGGKGNRGFVRPASNSAAASSTSASSTSGCSANIRAQSSSFSISSDVSNIALSIPHA